MLMLSRFDPSRADRVHSWSACQSRRWSGFVGSRPKLPKALATACSAARAAATSIMRSMSASEIVRGCCWVIRATIAAAGEKPAGAGRRQEVARGRKDGAAVSVAVIKRQAAGWRKGRVRSSLVERSDGNGLFQFVMCVLVLVLAFGLLWVLTFVVLLVISAHSFFLSPTLDRILIKFCFNPLTSSGAIPTSRLKLFS